MQHGTLLLLPLVRAARARARQTTPQLLHPSNVVVVVVVNSRARSSSVRSLVTLAIETSCDDTCVAIISKTTSSLPSSPSSPNGEKKNTITTTEIHFNEKITAPRKPEVGGIHPLRALESHRANLAKLVQKALVSLLAIPDRRRRGRGRGHGHGHGHGHGSPTPEDGGGGSSSSDDRARQIKKPDFVSVTRGPGMRSNLMCGLELAKGLAVAWRTPLVGVHHMQAHALTPRLVNALCSTGQKEPRFPFLTLLVSGGHTILLYSTGLTDHRILASTADVAVGDALDRTGWILLPEDIKAQARDTAFGKHLSQFAFPDQKSFASWPIPHRRKDEIDRPLNQYGWQIQAPLNDTRNMTFSFSGIESRVENILKKRESELQAQLGSEERILLARSAVGTAFEHLGSRTVMALENLEKQGISIQNLVISGGVAANDFLRYYLRAMLTARGFGQVGLIFPPIELCTDNAAMIGWAGIEMYEAGYSSDLGIDALRKWSMDASAEDGGILGVGGWNFRSSDPRHQSLWTDAKL